MSDNNKLSYEKRYGDIELLRRFFGYLKPYFLKLIVIIVGILSISVITLFPPIMFQRAFSLLEAKADWKAVFPYTLGYILLLTLLWIVQVFTSIQIVTLVNRVIKEIQLDTYKSLHSLDISFFDNHSTGQIMSRITNDTQELSGMINILSQFIANALVLVTVLVYMFIVNWKLTLVTMSMAPFVLIVALVFKQITRMTTGNWRSAIGEVNAAFQESVAGISVAKAFRREAKSKEDFKKINALTYKYAKKRAFAVMGIWPLMDGISVLGVFAITLYGSSLIFQGQASAGTILLFLLLLNRFLYPLLRIASQYSTIQSGFAAMDRIFGLMDTKKEIVNPPNPVNKEIEGAITFENVWFEYKKDVPVLKNINLKIRPKEKVAIVGHTGAGKTTIASLLMRYYDVINGSIQIDGIDIRDYDLTNLRAQIGLVSQDVFLFSGTVRENIVFGRPEATDEEIQRVISVVAAEEFIDALPQGLDTEIGERGKGLSAGQRQMISFARTLLTDPKILILDEATAAVDAYTEWKIQQALEKLLENRTSIIIAHRLTTIENADRIIVLDHGEIIEEGNHIQLMEKGGLYAELYETYFKHQSAEWIQEISEVFQE